MKGVIIPEGLPSVVEALIYPGVIATGSSLLQSQRCTLLKGGRWRNRNATMIMHGYV